MSATRRNKLSGKHVLIIGASTGIGFGVASAVLEQGASVTISSVNPAHLSAAVDKLSATYPDAASAKRIDSVICDLACEDALDANVTSLFASVAASHTISHVVFSAGDPIGLMPPVQQASLQDMKQAGMVRFFAPLLCAREAAKVMPKTAESSFTITGGIAASRPVPGGTLLSSYVAGIEGMTKSLALEMQPVRVNCVAPGAVDTEIWRALVRAYEAVLGLYGGRLLTGKVGTVEDVAEAYVYLMKDENVSGSVVRSNAGGILI